MKIGIPREIKNNENRVGLSPSGVHALVESGHTVLVETNAGSGSFFEDVDYKEAGAEMVAEQAKVWEVDMVIKVKEPLESKGKVTIIGGGQAGTNAAKIALGLGADVTILDVNPKRLQQLDDLFGGRVHTIMSNPLNIELYVKQSDLVIGAVLIPGAKAPRLVTEDMIKQMKNGSVIIDIAIDQGGIFETTDKITTHDDPTYIKHGVVHYAVANMPGAVPRTSTLALNNATLPYALMLANKGYREAFKSNQPLSLGLNTYKGHVTNKGVAEAFEMEYKSVEEALQL